MEEARIRALMCCYIGARAVNERDWAWVNRVTDSQMFNVQLLCDVGRSCTSTLERTYAFFCTWSSVNCLIVNGAGANPATQCDKVLVNRFYGRVNMWFDFVTQQESL